MRVPPNIQNGVSYAFAALFVALAIRSDALPHPVGRMASLPRTTLWAWERREDLHTLNPHQFAIAYLDQTLTISLLVDVQPRRNLLALPKSATRIPVVRIETAPNAILNDFTRAQAVRAILASAREPDIAAIQIDFDATRSQRAFYRDLLTDLRRQMPSTLPLSITALASWCSQDDWLGGLPIDEAVPMMFRMEPDRQRQPQRLDEFRIRDPLCASSVGVSTSESWPSQLAGKRVYIFPDKGWQNDSPAEIARRLP
jgi:hypothetical protein